MIVLIKDKTTNEVIEEKEVNDFTENSYSIINELGYETKVYVDEDKIIINKSHHEE